MGCCMMYCGDVIPKGVNDALNTVKLVLDLKFADWCPNLFEYGISNKPTLALKE